MPHLSLEYSANLDGRVDMTRLCASISQAIISTGLFEVGAVRVRALSAHAYTIADGMAENSFIDMSFRIGEGRTESEKKHVGEAIFAAAGDFLAPLFVGQHFALSLEIREIDPILSWKRNGMHSRLRTESEAI